MPRLAGKIAFITGAGTGIGRATAILFAREVAKVSIADIDAKSGEETAHIAGNEAIAIRTDVTDPDSCAAMVQAAVDAFGTVDILVNNAAIYDGLHMEAFEDLEIAEWERVMAVNVKGTWLATRAVSPIMKAVMTSPSLSSSTIGTLFRSTSDMSFGVTPEHSL